MHQHGGGFGLDALFALPLMLAIGCYVGAALRVRRTGQGWPMSRILLWAGGTAAAAAGFVGPLAARAYTDFTAHLLSHLLVGMLAPLLLVPAAPVTLALRSLPPVPARRLAHLLKSTPVRILSHPVTAGVLNVAPLWVLYATPAGAPMLDNPLVHLAVQLHFLVAGYLFTASIIGIDPSPHRAGFATRTAVLLLAAAGHASLSKYIYAHPPMGVPSAQAEAGGVLMYYGGDLIDLALVTVFCAQWYRQARPRSPGQGRPAARGIPRQGAGPP
ncbi:cytochrome c oxidase assembly protein [Arthrobacter mobilis]|uniref:Cytochrome c oxidase assembly protein n=1 Tax=Arthrobacter mobilis TaxID=2724944 RepID=A0A7X6H9W0_9MICC|nr:cytochrome c oxidase assembly protein [Arthrobacter mobilis]NKX53158.1 cytochrome c oxidase assembly protein [Arthrobacter mobilis]